MMVRLGKRLHGALACAAALGVAVSLTGCEIAGVTLPDLPLPEDFSLPELSLPDFEIPFLGGTTDPAEALDALASTTEDVTSPTIREAGTLTVGVNTYSTLAPMAIINADTSAVVGMDVDVAAALADELGLRVRFVPVENTDAAVANTVDIVLSTQAGSLDEGTVVGSYAEDALGFFHKGDAEVVDVSALMGATVGVQPGSASRAALDHTTLGMVTTDFETLNDAFAALEAGEVQYVLCDAYVGAYLAASYSDISFAGAINAPSVRGVAVASSNVALQQAVQQALDTIQSNGVLDVIRYRWVGNLPALTSAQQIANIPMVEDESEQAQDGDLDEDLDGDTTSEESDN